MLLLNMQEWIGPSPTRDSKLAHIDKKVRTRAFVTNLPLAKALERIRVYEDAFKAFYAASVSIEFELTAVSTIETLSESHIELARITMVEKLPQRKQDFE